MKVLDLSYHPLDVRSGKWVDLSRFGNHGTPHGGARPVMITPGVMGYWFDGSSGYVDCGSGESLNITKDITMSAWTYIESFPAEGYIIGKADTDSGEGYGAFIFSDSPNRFYYKYGGGFKYKASSNVIAKKWIYLVVSYNSITGRVGFFIDSIEELNTKAGDPSYISKNLTIGARESDELHFHGFIVQPIIEDRAWSEAEVRENMYRSPIYRMLRGLPHSMIYTKVPWKQQGGIYVP